MRYLICASNQQQQNTWVILESSSPHTHKSFVTVVHTELCKFDFVVICQCKWCTYIVYAHQQQQNTCVILESNTQIYTRDPRTCAVLIQAWGWIWGLPFFPYSKWLWFVRYVTYIYRDLSMKTNKCKRCKARGNRERLCFAFIFVCGQKPEEPQIEPPWLMTPLHRVV